MKRLVLSVVCAFVIPLLYSVIVGPLTPYIKNEPLKQLVGLPVRWPVIIYSQVLYLPFPLLLLYITACNVLVYGVLTYFILWKRAQGKVPKYPLPSPPSDFKI